MTGYCLLEWQSIILQKKLLIAKQIEQKNFIIIDRLVTELMNVSQPMRCIIASNDNPDTVVDLLKNNHGCEIVEQDLHYFYLFEAMGTMPCLPILLNTGLYVSRHWRLTIISQNHLTGIQVHYADLLTELAVCQHAESRDIHP